MTIKVITENNIARVVIAQPEKRNAVNPAMWDQIASIFPDLDADPNVRCIVLTGEGDAFCAGSDLGKLDKTASVADGVARLKRANRMVLAIHNCDTPVVSAVRGPAVGVGWSLALACDMTIAADDARFIAGFMKIGLVPDGGAVWFLSRHLGVKQAKDIAYFARTIGAKEALELGLVNEVAPVSEFETAVARVAQGLAQRPTHALGLAKRLFRESMGPGLSTFLESEELAQVVAKESPDFKEGVAAFMEKRSPDFTGR